MREPLLGFFDALSKQIKPPFCCGEHQRTLQPTVLGPVAVGSLSHAHGYAGVLQRDDSQRRLRSVFVVRKSHVGAKHHPSSGPRLHFPSALVQNSGMQGAVTGHRSLLPCKHSSVVRNADRGGSLQLIPGRAEKPGHVITVSKANQHLVIGGQRPCTCSVRRRGWF